MKRIYAITLLLAIAMLSASPAWALTLADHACCLPQTAAKSAAKPTQPKVAIKHAHCAAMAVKAAAQEPAISVADQQRSVYAQHKCGACAFGAMSAPRNVAAVSSLAQAFIPYQSGITTLDARVHALQASVPRDNRGPPLSLL